jgi:hypothetical protein
MSKIQTTYNKGTYLALESDDLVTVTRLVEDSLKRTKGKQAKYENSEHGLSLFMERATNFFAYINEVNENPDLEKKLIPDIENLCCYCGITRKTLAQYRKRNEQWEQAIDLIKDGIMACKKQLVQTHRMPPLVYIFDAVNNFGYRNATEFHLSTESPQDTMSPSIAESQLARIAVGAEAELPQLPEEDFSQD